jgi:hypothetical protein
MRVAALIAVFLVSLMSAQASTQYDAVWSLNGSTRLAHSSEGSL